MQNNVNVRSGEKSNSPCHSARFYSVASKRHFSVRKTGEQGSFLVNCLRNRIKMYLLVIGHRAF